MNVYERNWVTKSTERTLAVFAVIFLMLFVALLLCGPGELSPVFPNLPRH
jgi:hypothetical protein